MGSDNIVIYHKMDEYTKKLLDTYL